MSYLLDTNAISAPGKALRDAAFARGYDAASEQDIFVSAVTLRELRRAVARKRAHFDVTGCDVISPWSGANP